MAVAPDKDVVVKSGRSEQEEEPPDFEVVRRCVCLAEESSKKRHIMNYSSRYNWRWVCTRESQA